MYKIEIIRSKRRSVSIEVTADLSIVVRVPKKYPEKEIQPLLCRHEDWIKKAVNRRIEKNLKFPEPDCKEIEQLKKLAEETLPEKVKYYSNLTGLCPSNVKITSAKKRFGSCSGKNSLCFSYLLMRYPEECIDYVVLHEIIHIKYHNHSKEFYALVGKYMPDYKIREKKLKY